MADPWRSAIYCDERGRTRWGECAGCGAELPRRKGGGVSRTRVWHSRDCERDWLGNHYWTIARIVAMAGPPRAVRVVQKPYRAEPFRLDVAACRRCGAPADEVDHRVPREGAGYATGCHHHQANLQPLCRSCHAIKGVVWRAIRDVFARASVLTLPVGPNPLTLWGE